MNDLHVFLIKARGKIKPNIILAHDEVEAVDMFNKRYKNFRRSTKTRTLIDKPCILY